MDEFKGRVAVVTGAASGIGLAMAQTFAQQEMRVVLADIEQGALETAVASLTGQGAEAVGVLTDVSDADAVEALAQKTLDEFGTVHVLCNNAGVAGDLDFLSAPDERIWEHAMKDWEWTFGVNLWGVVHGLRSFVPRMLAHGEPGHIVNTASMAGLLSGATADIYGATKHAVVRMTEALYFQLAHAEAQIAASVLCPGIIKTRIFSSGRNRQAQQTASAPPSAAELGPRAEAADERWQSIPGLEPREVAEQVLESIKDKQLYILTRDVPLDRIRSRTEHIVEGTNPVVEPRRPSWRD